MRQPEYATFPYGQLYSSASEFGSVDEYRLGNLQEMDFSKEKRELTKQVFYTDYDHILANCAGASLIKDVKNSIDQDYKNQLEGVENMYPFHDTGMTLIDPPKISHSGEDIDPGRVRDDEDIFILYTQNGENAVQDMILEGDYPSIILDAGHYFLSGEEHRLLDETLQRVLKHQLEDY